MFATELYVGSLGETSWRDVPELRGAGVLTWEAIRACLEDLRLPESRRRWGNCLSLVDLPNPETTVVADWPPRRSLSIGTGPPGIFSCCIWDDRLGETVAIDPAAPDELVPVAFGYVTDRPRRWCVDFERVLAIARHFAETGEECPAVSWEVV